MADLEDPRNSIRPLSFGDMQRGIWSVFLLLIGIALIVKLQAVLILFAVTLILAMICNPLVARLQRHGIKRGLAVALLGVTLLALIVAGISFLLPPFLEQVQQLVQQAPDVWKRVYGQVQAFLKHYPFIADALPSQPNEIVQAAGSQVGGVASFLLRSTVSVVTSVILFVLCVLIWIFLLVNPEPLVAGYLELMVPRHREGARRTLLRLMHQMTAWARGVLINGIITAITTGLLLAWVGVQPAYVFGVFAFFGEFVPIIGPVIVAVPALLVAASLSLNQLLLAGAAILFVQQVETNILIPFVMGKQMDLHPVIIMFFTLAMGTIFGAIGALLVMPAAAFCKILIGEFYLRPRNEDKERFEAAAAQIVTQRNKIE